MLLLVHLAAALTCTEVMNMVHVNVPTNIVVATLDETVFRTEDLPCLRREGAPLEVIEAAERRVGVGLSAPAAPPRDVEPADPLPELARSPDAVGTAARVLLAHDAKAALDALSPDVAAPAAARYVAGRALLDLGLPTAARPLLSLEPGAALEPAAVTLLVDRRGRLSLPLVLENVPYPTAGVPARVREAFALAAALNPSNGQRVLGLSELRDAAADSPFAILAPYVYGVRTAALGHGPLLNDAGAAFRVVLSRIDAYGGRRVSRARAAELDNDRELTIIAFAETVYAAGKLDSAVALLDRIPRRSPRWERAQLAAVEVDAMRSDLTRAAARLRPLVDPNAPRLDWAHGRKPPKLRAADLTSPPEEAPIAVQEAWAQFALLTVQPVPCGANGRDIPEGGIAAYETSLAGVQARGEAWAKALKAGATPPSFAAALSTPRTRLAHTRLDLVVAERATLAGLAVGDWGSAELVRAEGDARMEVTVAEAEAREMAVRRAREFAAQAQIVRFESAITICDHADYMYR